jgi:hypothetical protein
MCETYSLFKIYGKEKILSFRIILPPFHVHRDVIATVRLSYSIQYVPGVLSSG